MATTPKTLGDMLHAFGEEVFALWLRKEESARIARALKTQAPGLTDLEAFELAETAIHPSI